MLPGLKRWIAVIIFGICVIVFGVLVLLGKHPVHYTLQAFSRALYDITQDLPHRVTGIIAVSIGGIFVFMAILKLTSSILGAYLPADRESIPDVLYRRRHLDRGPKVVVVGGGHGLSNLLRGLKGFTNNLTAIVTVGDDGGSSGRLRQELGVLPPGDIRNCITALADEDKLVTDLFKYRFAHGDGLEGHSFGNLFLTAVCAITNGDMLEAARVASRVLNSCGQVLPSTLSSMVLIAEMEDGRVIRGESVIPDADGRIKRLSCEPELPDATPEALEAIANADMIVLGPGSLYTSIIPNLLVKGVPQAIIDSPARKVYVCNTMTQKGETTSYTVGDHVETLMQHVGINNQLAGGRFIEGVMINVQAPNPDSKITTTPVRYDPDRLRHLGVRPILRPLLSEDYAGHHDPQRLAEALMLWYFRQKPGRVAKQPKSEAKRSNNGSFSAESGTQLGETNLAGTTSDLKN